MARITNLRIRPGHYLDAWAEEVLGESIELSDTFTAYHGPFRWNPREERALCFPMPASGVPLGIQHLPKGLRVTRVHAGVTELYRSTGNDEGRKMMGAPCVEGQSIWVEIQNESDATVELDRLDLQCAMPPILFVNRLYDVDELPPREVVADLAMRFRVLQGPHENEHEGIHSPLHATGHLFKLNQAPPRLCRECRAPFKDDLLVECGTLGTDRWTAPLAFVLPPELGEHYALTMIVMGEKPVVQFRRPVPGEDFQLGCPRRPPLPFITVPPRQSMSVVGVKLHGRPAPPFEVLSIWSVGKKTVA